MNLHTFITQLNKLKKYCIDNHISISISFVSPKNGARKVDETNYLIMVSPYQSFSNIISSALHKIGHVLVYKSLSNEYRDQLREIRIRLNRDCELTEYEKDLILDEEDSAWVFGEKLAKELNIDVNNDFYQIWERSFSSYKKHFQKVISN